MTNTTKTPAALELDGLCYFDGQIGSVAPYRAVGLRWDGRTYRFRTPHPVFEGRLRIDLVDASLLAPIAGNPFAWF